MSEELEREQFEQWWTRDVPESHRTFALQNMKQSRFGDGIYGNTRAQEAWRGWQARAAAPQAVTLSDEQRNVINDLVNVTREAFIALDDSEEREGPDGREHVIDSCAFDSLHDALERLEDLPDDKPGQRLSAAGKAKWALRALLAAHSTEQRMSDADSRLGALVRRLSIELSDSPKSFLANVQRAIEDLSDAARKGDSQ